MVHKMQEYTQEQIDNLAKNIKTLNQYELCQGWRFAKSGDPRFRNDLITSEGISLGELYSNCLTKSGGFTPAISKALGW